MTSSISLRCSASTFKSLLICDWGNISHRFAVSSTMRLYSDIKLLVMSHQKKKRTKLMSCNSGTFRSSIVLDGFGWTTPNFENLSMQVRKNFLSVEKMSTCNIFLHAKGFGVSPIFCFLGCLSYLAVAQVLQFCKILLAKSYCLRLDSCSVRTL